MRSHSRLIRSVFLIVLLCIVGCASEEGDRPVPVPMQPGPSPELVENGQSMLQAQSVEVKAHYEAVVVPRYAETIEEQKSKQAEDGVRSPQACKE